MSGRAETAGRRGAGMRLLVRLPNWVGDVVMASAALRVLRRTFTHARISVLAKPHLLPIVRGSGWYDEEIALTEGEGPFGLGRRLRARRFTHALLFTHSWSSAIAAFWARIPVRIGHANDGRAWLLTDALPLERSGRIHPVPALEAYLALCRSLGCRVNEDAHRIALPVGTEARTRARDWFEARGLGDATGSRAPIAMNVGAGFGPSKHWPAVRWARVADHFARRGRAVLVYGGPGDVDDVESVVYAAAHERVLPVLGVGLDELAAHMERVALLISTDSGGRHFGPAVGTPTIVLMGPNHPELSECRGNLEHYVVLLRRPPCWPCHLRTCPIDHRCMREITSAEVIAAAERWLAGRHPFDGATPWITPPGREHALFRGACCG